MSGFAAWSRSGRPAWSPALAFAIPQFVVSNFLGPSLVDIVAAVVLHHRPLRLPQGLAAEERSGASPRSVTRRTRSTRSHGFGAAFMAWMPWIVLSVFVFIWGLPVGEDLAERHLRARPSR